MDWVLVNWTIDQSKTIRNDNIRESIEISPIVKKIMGNKFRWFVHVDRRIVDSIVRRIDMMKRRQKIKSKGRQKKIVRNY